LFEKKAIINQNEYHVIELRKHQANGFGFSIRGGKEFNIPLFVLKLAPQGPAALDARLQIGDQILEINGFDAYSMTHHEAIERIKSGGNMVTLLIRRTGLPPPSITDIIAANTNAAVQTAQQNLQQQQQMIPSLSTNNLNNNELIMQQQQQNMQLRSKSPYLNQPIATQQQQQHNQMKNFNSTATLINRNF
jgi:C-terminal processing protease CtpA/Prc